MTPCRTCASSPFHPAVFPTYPRGRAGLDTIQRPPWSSRLWGLCSYSVRTLFGWDVSSLYPWLLRQPRHELLHLDACFMIKRQTGIDLVTLDWQLCCGRSPCWPHTPVLCVFSTQRQPLSNCVLFSSLPHECDCMNGTSLLYCSTKFFNWL